MSKQDEWVPTQTEMKAAEPKDVMSVIEKPKVEFPTQAQMRATEPKPVFPEPPTFVAWTYDAQMIEEFRKKYDEFQTKYKELRSQIET